MIKTLIFGRTTPFIFVWWLGLVAVASAAEARGRWLFVDDGSGVEIAPCPTAADGLCGTLVQLPKHAARIASGTRRQLCGLTLLGSLQVGKPGKDELLRLDGWVLDPEHLVQAGQPVRYDVSLIMTSAVSARLDVHGPLNVVLESHRLIRPIVPAAACE